METNDNNLFLQCFLFIEVDIYVLIDKLIILLPHCLIKCAANSRLPTYLPQSEVEPLYCCLDAVKTLRTSMMVDMTTKKGAN